MASRRSSASCCRWPSSSRRTCPRRRRSPGAPILSWDDAKGAAEQIVGMGARSVVVTGGHFNADHNATDLYYDGRGFRDFTAIRIDTPNTHGTGCTFSAAIAAGLAKGMATTDAVALAKSYVTLAMQHAYPIGLGHGPCTTSTDTGSRWAAVPAGSEAEMSLTAFGFAASARCSRRTGWRIAPPGSCWRSERRARIGAVRAAGRCAAVRGRRDGVGRGGAVALSEASRGRAWSG